MVVVSTLSIMSRRRSRTIARRRSPGRSLATIFVASLLFLVSLAPVVASAEVYDWVGQPTSPADTGAFASEDLADGPVTVSADPAIPFDVALYDTTRFFDGSTVKLSGLSASSDAAENYRLSNGETYLGSFRFDLETSGVGEQDLASAPIAFMRFSLGEKYAGRRVSLFIEADGGLAGRDLFEAIITAEEVTTYGIAGCFTTTVPLVSTQGASYTVSVTLNDGTGLQTPQGRLITGPVTAHNGTSFYIVDPTTESGRYFGAMSSHRVVGTEYIDGDDVVLDSFITTGYFNDLDFAKTVFDVGEQYAGRKVKIYALDSALPTSLSRMYEGTVPADGVISTWSMSYTGNTSYVTTWINPMVYTIVLDGGGIVPGGDDEPSGGLFSDVREGDWFYGSVERAVELGLMNGYQGSDRFGPLDGLKREQAATVLWNALASGDKSAPDAPMADVAQGQWYSPFVNWAVSTGAMSGYDDGRFGIDDTLTREQFAAALAKACKADTSSADISVLDGFVDADSVSPWATKALAWAVEAGVMSGEELEDGGRALRPDRALIRAEMAAMTVNAVREGVLELR